MNTTEKPLVKYKTCPICGCHEFGYLLSSGNKYEESKRKYNVLCCEECGYCFTFLPSDIDPVTLYSDDYRQLKKGISNIHKKIYQLYYSLIFPYKWFPEGAKILDVGCGNGLFSFFLKNKGFEVSCIERNPKSVEFARESFGLDLKNCELKDASFPDDEFHVVILRHSLEHIADIHSTLREVKRVLKEKGMLFIECPNINCAECRLFRSCWYHLDLPVHLHHFCKDNLLSLLTRYNFEVKFLGYDNFMPHTISMSFIFSLEKLIHKRIQCIIRKIIFITLYPLSIIISSLFSISGKGSIIRLLALRKGE